MNKVATVLSYASELLCLHLVILENFIYGQSVHCEMYYQFGLLKYVIILSVFVVVVFNVKCLWFVG